VDSAEKSRVVCTYVGGTVGGDGALRPHSLECTYAFWGLVMELLESEREGCDEGSWELSRLSRVKYVSCTCQDSHLPSFRGYVGRGFSRPSFSFFLFSSLPALLFTSSTTAPPSPSHSRSACFPMPSLVSRARRTGLPRHRSQLDDSS